MVQKVKEADNLAINSQEIEYRITYRLLEDIFQKISKVNYARFSLLPLMVIVVMWSQVDHVLLIGWGLLILVSMYIRYKVAVSYINQGAPFSEAKKWGNRFTLASIFSSLLWSLAVFLFYVQGSVEHQVFLLTLCVMLGMSSIISGIYWFPSFYVFAVPVMGSIALRLIFEASLAYIALSIFVLWFLVIVTSMAKGLHKSMRSEMQLRHESEELAEALHIKTEEAQQATQAKSKFLAAASHDLRQPMHALSLFIDALKGSESEIERANIFPSVELSLDALRKLFDALLDISRLDAKVVKPEMSHFNLSDILKVLVEEFTPAANEKKLKLKIHADVLVVVSDRLLLERILRNLISNAIRYTESGGVLLSARIRGDKVLLQVWDTGIGIPQESKDEVFIEFQQLHNANRDRTQGLGLGLAIVRRLCKLLDHPLTLRSQQGKGSVFSVSIPKGDANLMMSANTDTIIHSWDLSGRFILVIDDEHDILDAMQTLLSRWGCDVVAAESLEDAIEVLNKNKVVPDLILSDLRLRNEMTGIEAINSLKKQFGASIGGILITGETSPEQIKLAKESGYEVLQKPVKPMLLRAVIHHYFSDPAN